MRWWGWVSALSAALLAVASAAQAQLTTPGIPTPAGPSYGYQPYNPSQPTGFNHPNEQGFGTYRNPTHARGYRSPGLAHRRFRGY